MPHRDVTGSLQKAWQAASSGRSMLVMDVPYTAQVSSDMLRITTQEGPTAITLVLEGKCRGPWVEELQQCWRQATTLASGRPLRVDLEKVGFADERGKELLAAMYDAGVQLNAVGLMMTSLVEEIVASSSRKAKQRA